jgi:hypothetical protein
MTELSPFLLDRFLSLSGPELRDYAEPFVNTHKDAIRESVYEPLQSKLRDLDEEHTVYALEICMLLKPDQFASRAVQFLSHSDSAVCCTAFRIIERLPSSFIRDHLGEQISGTPVVDLFSTHVRTGDRVRVGTNEEFIRELVAKTT